MMSFRKNFRCFQSSMVDLGALIEINFGNAQLGFEGLVDLFSGNLLIFLLGFLRC